MKRTTRALLRPLAIGAFRIVDRLRAAPHRYILILSHMRSGSTLLVHLLMTHPKISGCGERNDHYRNYDDLAVLALKSNFTRPRKFLASWSVDQINHTHFVHSDELLSHPSVYPIILFREPVGTIGSMVDVFPRFYDFDVNDALEHYRQRLPALTHYAKYLKSQGRVLSLTYDDLVNKTQESLSRLVNYLHLPGQLSDHYSTFDFTGTRGDPSDRIRTGKVLPERVKSVADLDGLDFSGLNVLFEECRRTAHNDGSDS